MRTFVSLLVNISKQQLYTCKLDNDILQSYSVQINSPLFETEQRIIFAVNFFCILVCGVTHVNVA